MILIFTVTPHLHVLLVNWLINPGQYGINNPEYLPFAPLSAVCFPHSPSLRSGLCPGRNRIVLSGGRMLRFQVEQGGGHQRTNTESHHRL